MNFIQDRCERFSQDSKSTFHWLLQVCCMNQKMHISEYVCKTFLSFQELAFLSSETFEKLLQSIMFLKMLLFHRYFFDPFQSSSSPFQQITPYHSNSCALLHTTKWRMQIFDPVACGDTADNASGCQMMGHSHVEKDLNRNDHLNSYLE